MTQIPFTHYPLLFSFRLFISVIVFAGFLFVLTAQAVSPSDIAFPVAELGNCKDKAMCKAYCDQSEHKKVCVDFAERHGLLSREQAKISRRVVAVENGPGGCRSHTDCENYCEKPGNIEVCLEFAESQGLLSGEELRGARAVSRALRAGHRLPGGCAGKAACEAYCEESAHLAECLEFAEAAELIPPEELADAKKVARALQAGQAPPGGCRGRRQCEAYCNAPENIEECLEFALVAGFIDPSEAEEARRVLPLLKNGQTPGKCKSKLQCEAYCQHPDHLVECAEFAVKAGFIPPEEAAMLKKVLPLLQAGQTPGKCRSKQQCEAYCQDSAHRQECTEFALKAGLMSPDDLRQMKEGMERMRESLVEAPVEVRACLEQRLGVGVVAQIEAGTLSSGFDTGEHFRECFEDFAPRPGVEFEHEESSGPRGGERRFERREWENHGEFGDESGDYGGSQEFFPEEPVQHYEAEYFDEGVEINAEVEEDFPSADSDWQSSSLLQRVVRSRPEPKIVRLLKTIIGRETAWGR